MPIEFLSEVNVAQDDATSTENSNQTEGADIDALKAQFLNTDFDTKVFELNADKIVAVAKLSGETRAEFTDPDHPDFQAPPAYLCSLASGRHLPIDFPRLGGIPMDGGKAVTIHAPVRGGQTLTGRTHLHDIYDKKGRSGRMILIVARLELYDADENHLASADSNMVIREKPKRGDKADGANA